MHQQIHRNLIWPSVTHKLTHKHMRIYKKHVYNYNKIVQIVLNYLFIREMALGKKVFRWPEVLVLTALYLLPEGSSLKMSLAGWD